VNRGIELNKIVGSVAFLRYFDAELPSAAILRQRLGTSKKQLGASISK